MTVLLPYLWKTLASQTLNTMRLIVFCETESCFFTGLKLTVVEPSFQHNISNAALDLIWFLFLMPKIVQGLI